jgi:hypothetical protein
VVVAALTGAVTGILGLVKGEPKAVEADQKAVAVYETLQQKSNEHGEAINRIGSILAKMRLQLTYSEGFKMGYKEHKAELKVLELQQRIDELQGKRPPAAAPARVVTTSTPALAPKCEDGYVSDGKRCKKVPRAVAKAVDKVKKEALDAKRKLELERMKRKQMEQQIQSPAPPAPPQMKMLPSRLKRTDLKGD